MLHASKLTLICSLFLFLRENNEKFLWISGPYCSRLFRQPNYWRSASYVTCFAIQVNLHDFVAAYTHACLQCMLRQRFIPSILQGNLQLRRGRTINKHNKAFWAKHTDHSTTEAAEWSVHSLYHTLIVATTQTDHIVIFSIIKVALSTALAIIKRYIKNRK